ncbi:hypothetical protein MBANPS3_008289 [Mucor bainieri]
MTRIRANRKAMTDEQRRDHDRALERGRQRRYRATINGTRWEFCRQLRQKLAGAAEFGVNGNLKDIFARRHGQVLAHQAALRLSNEIQQEATFAALLA